MSCLSIISTKIDFIKIASFSPLPYSIFKTSINKHWNFEKQLHLNKRTNQYRMRGALVSLRAPKHFKAGKQQYSLTKRIQIYCFKNKLNKKVTNVDKSNNNFFFFFKKAQSAYNRQKVQAPMAITKTQTIKILFNVKFSFANTL